MRNPGKMEILWIENPPDLYDDARMVLNRVVLHLKDKMHSLGFVLDMLLCLEV